jgi:hypothetical protein
MRHYKLYIFMQLPDYVNIGATTMGTGGTGPPNFWVHGTIYILVPPKFCLPLCNRTDTEYQLLQLNTIAYRHSR